MKIFFAILAIAACSAFTADADIIHVTFDQPGATVSPGQTLQVFGTITNTSNFTVNLNGDSIDLSGLSFAVNDLFFADVPATLAPAGQAGDSTGDIELFDISVSDPLLDSPGSYAGAYTVTGGASADAQDVLGQASFSVTTTPEPSTLALLSIALFGCLAPIYRRLRARTR